MLRDKTELMKNVAIDVFDAYLFPVIQTIHIVFEDVP